MPQQAEPDKFDLCMVHTQSVRELVEMSFQAVVPIIHWEDEGGKEIGRDGRTANMLVSVNPIYYRPA